MSRTMPKRTASHRPAQGKRRNKHDAYRAVDLFSGFGGLTLSIKAAGIDVISAANHNRYKVEVHEANHPDTEHWIADLVDKESSDYHDVRDLPAAEILVAGISCRNHSQANSKRAYAQGLTLFDLGHDPEFEEQVTNSERDRATANCVLHYAERHHPLMMLVECTTELTSWGRALPNRPKVGDGSTFRWWLKQTDLLGYRHKILYLNSMFFGVAQSRDRLFIVFWKKHLPAPDLEHRPVSWCGGCHEVVEGIWSWRTGVPPTGVVRYGVQYDYRCPRCRKPVTPASTPSLNILDLTKLGTRIGDRKKPLAPATMARAERCRRRFPQYPGVLMPAKSIHGVERHPWQPMATQTGQRETGLLSTGGLIAAAGHTFERPGSQCRTRDFSQPMWAQTGTNTTGVLTPPVALAGQIMPGHRHNGDGKHITLPMDTVTGTPEKALLLAAVNNFQGAPRPVDMPLPTQPGSETLGLVTAGIIANRENATSHGVNSPTPTVVANAGSGGLSLLSTGVIPYRQNTLPAVHGEPMMTVTSDQIPGLLIAAGSVHHHDDLAARWADALADIRLEDCHFRMLFDYEVGRGCGFDTTYPGQHEGTFKVWGSARDQVNGYGNAVSPAVGEWIGRRMRASLHGRAES